MTTGTAARLRSLYPALTESERRVADTILRYEQSIPDWSGRDLAMKSETTEPTIFRLAGKLGFSGFKALKLALLSEQAVERTREELGIFNIPIDRQASVPVQAQEIFRAYVDSLKRTASLVDPDRVNMAAHCLRDAALVSLIGAGSSQAVAILAENLLVRCGIPCRFTSDSHMQLLYALEQKPGHVFVGFSYSGDTLETVETLEIAKTSGAHTIAITAFEQSPITANADLVLLLPAIDIPEPYRVGLVDAVLPFLMLLDLLAIRITTGDPVRAAHLRDRVEQTVRRRKLIRYRETHPFAALTQRGAPDRQQGGGV